MPGVGVGVGTWRRRQRVAASQVGPLFSLADPYALVNGAPGTVVSAFIPDSGTITGLSLLNDAGGRFAISGGNLVIGSVPPDFEITGIGYGDAFSRGRSRYTVTVRATFGDGSQRVSNFNVWPHFPEVAPTGHAGAGNPTTINVDKTQVQQSNASLRFYLTVPSASDGATTAGTRNNTLLVIDPALIDTDAIGNQSTQNRSQNLTVRGHRRFNAFRGSPAGIFGGTNQIWENMQFLVGDDLVGRNPDDRDAFKISYGENILFRNCTFGWSIDEVIEIWRSWSQASRYVRNLRFDRCLFAEPLLGSAGTVLHSQAPHNYGMLIGTGHMNIQVTRCVFYAARQRSPEISMAKGVYLANNIIIYSGSGVAFQKPDGTHFNEYGELIAQTTADRLATTALIENNLFAPMGGATKNSAFVLYDINAGSFICQRDNHFFALGDFAADPVVSSLHTQLVRLSTLDSFVIDPPFRTGYAPLPTGTEPQRLALWNDVMNNVGVREVDGARNPLPGDHQASAFVSRTLGKIRSGAWAEVDSVAAAGGYTTDLPTPPQLANLWGAWRPQDAVSDADGVVSIAGAYGTTRQALGGAGTAKPDALMGLGPNSTSVMRFEKARLEHLAIPAFSMNQSFTLVAAFSPTTQASIDGVILGQAASTSHRIRVPSAGTSVQCRIGGPSEVTVPFAAGSVVANEMAIVAFVYDAVAQTATAYLNGVAGTATALANGAVTLDAIGRSGTAYANSQMGELLLYTIALTPAEVASVTTFLSAFRSTSYFVAANGSDSNIGWSSAAPMLTPATAITRPIRPGGGIRLRGGDTFGGLGTITLAGQSGAPITIGSYGTGRARIWGNSPVTSGWTDAGGGLWTRSVATAPLVVLHCPDGAAHVPTQPSDFRRLANQSTSNDWSFQWAAGVLTIRTDGVLSPNGAEFVVIESGAAGVTVQNTAPWLTLEGLDIRYHGGFGVRPFGPNGVARDCHAIGNANDGFAPSVAGAWSILGADNLAAFNGTGISGAGDGASWHGASTGSCENLTTLANAVGGIRNEGGSNVTVTGGSDRGNAIDVTLLAQGGTGGALSLTNRTIRVTAASGSGNAAVLASGAGVTLTVTGCTFIREAGGQPNAIAANGNTVVDGGGNTLVGFTSLT